MSNFIALDVETANADLASICSIGLVQFVDGRVVKRLHYLIDPEDHFDGINMAIHGITPAMVAGHPTMRAVYPLLTSSLSGAVVVHHMPFDRVAMRRAGVKHGHGEIACTWLDTARVARRAWAEVAYEGYALAKLAKRFSIQFQHHDAAEDAYVAGTVLMHAITSSGLPLEHWIIRSAAPLAQREYNPSLKGDRSGAFGGENIVFTGALSIARHEAAAIAAAAGCNVAKAVSKSTSMLVVGDQDIRRLLGADKSAKHREAEALIAKGQPIRIVGETDFLDLMTAGGSPHM